MYDNRGTIITVDTVNAFVKTLKKKNIVQLTVHSSISLTESSHLEQKWYFHVHKGPVNVL